MPSSAVAQAMTEVIFESQVCSAGPLDYTEVNSKHLEFLQLAKDSKVTVPGLNAYKSVVFAEEGDISDPVFNLQMC
ncbi:uncharacterized [Tachysurus ichikawai]